MNGFTVAFVCPACLARFGPEPDDDDDTVELFGMKPIPLHLDCVDDLLFEGYDLVPTENDPDVFYLLCPHERETSRPHRPANCCQLAGGDCWHCATGSDRG